MELAPHISLLGINRSPGGISVDNNFFFFIWYRKDILQSKTRFVVFPTYWYFANKRDTTKLFFPFYLKRKTETSKYLNVAFLYNQKYSLKEKKNSLFPIWWHSVKYYGSDTIKKDLVLPFYFSKKSKYENRKLLFPLIYNVKDQQRQSFTFFPLFSCGHRFDSSSKYFAATPLFWHIKNKSGIKNVLFPVYWNFKDYYRNDTIERQVVFPFVWTYRSKTAINTTILPFYYNYQNKYRTAITVLPFFSTYEEFKTGYGYKMITPFYWKTRSSSESREVLFPVYWSRTSYNRGDTTFRKYIFPLFFSGRTRTKNYQVLFPIIYRFKSEDYRSLTIFPLFAYGRSSDASRRLLAITPLFWRVKTKHGLTRVFLPFYWNNKHTGYQDTTFRHGVFPFYWSTKNKTKHNTFVFPFVFKVNNKERESLTLFPLFSYGHQKDSSRKYIGITPFFYRIQSKRYLTHVFIPIYWNVKRYDYNDTVRTEVLFPLVWLYHRKDKDVRTVFPFMFSYRDKYRESFTVFPLFSHGHRYDSSKSHLVVTPFYWHSQTKTHVKDVIFPFYWHKNIYENGDTLRARLLFPVFLYTKSRTELNFMTLPGIFRTKNKYNNALTVLPVFSWAKHPDSTSHLIILPFLYFKNKHNVKTTLFPVYWSRKYYLNNDTITKSVFFPLYWADHSNHKKTDIFFPLIWKFKNDNYSSFTFFPLCSFGHGANEKKHLMITPLFGKFDSHKSSNTFLFPVFNYRRSGEEKHYAAFLFLFMRTTKPGYSKTAILWPICEQLRDKDKRKFRIAPIVWFSKTDSSKVLSVQPLFYSNRTKEKNTFILSAFLYKRENVFNKSVANSFLLRLCYHKNYTNGDFERRVLHLIITNVKVEGHREKSFLPFFHTVKEENGDRSVSYFFGLYNRFREYKPEIKDFYEEERLFWFIRLRSNYKQLKSEGKDAFVRKRHKKK